MSNHAAKPAGGAGAFIEALRPAQWTKNAVVLAPFFFAWGDRTQQVSAGLFGPAALAATLFCVVSSAIYLLNDVRDVAQDRLHPVKRLRPIAASRLSPAAAMAGFAVLLAAGLAGALALSHPFAAVVAGYALLQILYSVCLKRVALLDVFVISAGFVLRAMAGGAAIGVALSPWLLLCAMLLALFLALCKRRHEKRFVADASEHRPSLGGYDARLLDQLIGIAAAVTIVSYAMYTLSHDTVLKFGSSSLGFTIPFVMFGMFRYLDLVYRHEKGGHPEQVLLTDVPTLVNLALYALTVVGIFVLR